MAYAYRPEELESRKRRQSSFKKLALALLVTVLRMLSLLFWFMPGQPTSSSCRNRPDASSSIIHQSGARIMPINTRETYQQAHF